ncbi:MAG: hypothetical protein JSV04_09750 [Candidatus Heimdallarchaeota archaeon]|nr:MAG: hypothetical protein JSV04_09750 [Candidatus Heimdallarchaeota archaeon]
MQFICEIVPSSFLTPLRRTLAHELAQLGFKQMEIAHVLGVSQPVVSSYLKSPLSTPSSLTSRSAFEELVSKLISRIKTESVSSLDLMELICQECQQFRAAGPLCDVHRKKSELNFPPDCNICFPSAELAEVFNQKLQATKALFQAAQRLVNTGEKFGQLIPEIGCQFVYITENYNTSADIAGFPGRIVKVKGMGQIVSSPEFGHGSTLAQILSFFQKRGSNKRALISLRHTPEILTAITHEKVSISTKEADRDWDQTLQSFSKEEIRESDVIADAGGVGLEPIIYLFGKTPDEIVDFLISKF